MELMDYESLMESLRTKRKQLGLQQRSVAQQAGIAPSTLNRMENHFHDANYRTVYNVWCVIHDAETQDSETAADLMHDSVLYANVTDTHDTVAQTMREKGFSQMPVKDENGVVVGSISERVLAENIDHETQIAELMEEEFSQIKASTPKSSVRRLLIDGQDALLVIDSGNVIGIITTADLI
ncbi:CBS domain-containing protein [Haloferax volcanii]|uniref:CBS domain-containing protein n=1 Tax=Haloferax volcanii TaxID=2246 RepID=UPI0038537094